MNLRLVLMVFAFVCFVLSSLPYAPTAAYWNRLIGAGLACWVGSLLFS